MIQVQMFGGNRAAATEEEVNEWLADRNNEDKQVLDIKHTYSDGYNGVMIIYEDRPDKDRMLNKFVNLPRYK